jgi:CRP-like cAMP-binding protein
MAGDSATRDSDDGAIAALIVAIGHPLRVPANSMMFRAGDATDGLYAIERGTVRLDARTPGDGEVRLATIGAGGMVGEFSLLDSGPRSATARAIEDVEALRVEPARFEALALAGNAAATALLARLRRDVAERTRATIAAIGAALGGRAAVPRMPAALPLAQAGPAHGMAAMLASFPGFDRFDRADWDALEAHATMIAAPRGTRIAAPGDDAAHLIIVGRGAVRAGLACDDGEEQLLVHGPGSFAGSCAATDGASQPLALFQCEEGAIVALPIRAIPALPVATGARLQAMTGRQMVRDLRRLSRALGRIAGERG